MASKTPLPNFNKIGKELRLNASRYAASESVKFFKESFVNGGFTGSSFQKWSQTNNPLAGKRTMQKTYKLMRSIKKKSADINHVRVIADSDYAEIHNSGGTIEVTAQMKKYFWAKYYEFTGKVTVNKHNAVSLNQTNRTLGAKAMFCKRMALLPVGHKIKIPQHQFMGDSPVMMRSFDKWFGLLIKTQVEKKFDNPIFNIQLKQI